MAKKKTKKKVAAKKSKKKTSRRKKATASARTTSSEAGLDLRPIVKFYSEYWDKQDFLKEVSPKDGMRRFLVKNKKSFFSSPKVQELLDAGFQQSQIEKCLKNIHQQHLGLLDPVHKRALDCAANMEIPEGIREIWEEKAESFGQVGDDLKDVSDFKERAGEGPRKSVFEKRKTTFLSVGAYLEEYGRSYKLEVPAYQRPYVWGKKNIDQLLEETEGLDPCGQDIAPLFLGAVLVQPTGSKSEWILDGQQRTATFLIIIAVACRILRRAGFVDLARGIVKEYVADRRSGKGRKWMPNFIPDSRDQFAFGDVLKGIFDSSSKHEPWDFSNAPEADRSSVQKTDRLRIKDNAEYVASVFEKRFCKNGLLVELDGLLKVMSQILNTSALCKFELAEEDDPFGTFQRLNYAGEELQNSDLVRSIVLSKVRGSRNQTQHQAGTMFKEKTWDKIEDELSVNVGATKPKNFYKRSKIDDFFTCLVKYEEPGTKKSQSVQELRKIWKDKSAEEIVSQVKKVKESFLLLSNFEAMKPAGLKKLGVDAKTKEMLGLCAVASVIGLSQEVTPALMGVVNEYLLSRGTRRTKPRQSLIDSLKLCIAWHIRHAVITGGSQAGLQGIMTKVIQEVKSGTSFVEAFWDHADTKDQKLYRLDDQSFKAELLTLPIYEKRRIARSALLLLDFEARPLKMKEGKHDPRLNARELDHLCPQTLAKKRADRRDWDFWKKTDHAEFKNRLGNLALLEREINAEAGQDGFEKRASLAEDASQCALTRRYKSEVLNDHRWSSEWHSRWGKEAVQARTEDLCDKLVQAIPFDAARSRQK